MVGDPDPELHAEPFDHVVGHLAELRRLLVQFEQRIVAEHYDAAVDDAERVNLEAARLLGAVDSWASR
jgi:hypothetical protein